MVVFIFVLCIWVGFHSHCIIMYDVESNILVGSVIEEEVLAI